MTKTACLFPGQGAQYVGMGASLAGELPAVRALFDQAHEILGYDLLQICAEGPAPKLNSTVYSQPALFVCGLAALEKLRIVNPSVIDACRVAGGLSLGEYTALVFAGTLDFADGLRLVQVRGESMQAASDQTPSGMVSLLGLSREQVDELCATHRHNQILEIANFLCPGNLVVSGHLEACQRIAAAAESAGAMKAIPLAVAGAFHTSLMEPALERLRAALAAAEFRAPRIPVVCNVDAQPHDHPDDFAHLLERQVVSPVLWEASMRWLIGECGVEQCYELGPGKVLRGLLKRIERRFPSEGIET